MNRDNHTDTVGAAVELDFRVLGPLRVFHAGRELELHGDKPRAVLALLLTRRNRLVPTPAFAEEVWGKDASGHEHAQKR